MSEIMSEKVKALFLIFKKAVDSEREAQQTYKDALSKTDDPFLKRILKGFYEDEVRHEKELMEQYKRLRNHFGDIENEE